MAKLPPEILKALRGRGAPADPDRLSRLASRIDDAAAPMLADRRNGRATAGWWDLPATWAATLIPASLAIAAASLLVLWRVTLPKPVMEMSEVTVLRAAAPISNPAAVDEAVNALITPQPRMRR
jgi:hypothetical protein